MKKNTNTNPRYYYNFAEIVPATHMCIGVRTTTSDDSGYDNLVPIPVFDEEYILKYYLCENHPEFTYDCLDGKWYEDPEGTIPWESPLLPKE